MTKKDYVRIARAVAISKSQMGPLAQAGINLAAIELADELQEDNQHFDRARFLRACGFDGLDG